MVIGRGSQKLMGMLDPRLLWMERLPCPIWSL